MSVVQSPAEISTRGEKILHPLGSKRDIEEIRDHLKEVIESSAFRGSHRSAQFLKYICEQAIAGQIDSLKERAIGVELFGRLPSYDTGEDAIVRVTASDVRKRLSHYYLGAAGSSSDVCIKLPVGSYVPEFTRDIRNIAEFTETASQPAPQNVPAAEPAHPDRSPVDPQGSRLSWLVTAVCLVVILGLTLWNLFGKPPALQASSRISVLPWSAFFAKEHSSLLVTSDPNIAEIQGLTGQPVTLSDYANQEYVPNESSLSPLLIHVCRDVLRGDKAASVDTPIVAGVAELAAKNGSRINVRAARDLHFSDFDTDENLIFLGSPRTDPWTSLYEDQMDFRFKYDTASRQEIIENAHPRSGEPSEYVPTAKGFATGQSFAVISFVRNPNHAGNVLILAGANAEGTKATGELVTNPSSLAAALERCNIRPSSSASDPVQHFQMLLHLRMMAGSPTAFDIAACHILP